MNDHFFIREMFLFLSRLFLYYVCPVLSYFSLSVQVQLLAMQGMAADQRLHHSTSPGTWRSTNGATCTSQTIRTVQCVSSTRRLSRVLYLVYTQVCTTLETQVQRH